MPCSSRCPPRLRAPGIVAGLAALLGAGVVEGASAAEPLTLHYQDRPPYSSADAQGRVSGLVATPAALALEKAGLPYQWARTPAQRQLALIERGNGLHCGIGWLRKPEREGRGKFSRPLYRDRPFIALAHPSSPLPSPARLEAALEGEAAHSLLLKEGYSYGAAIDGWLARSATPPRRTGAEAAQMVRMVAAGRAGWMITAPEEAQVLEAEAGAEAAQLRRVTFSDAPPSETRHLYCNHAVPDDWMARIDKALASLPASPKR